MKRDEVYLGHIADACTRIFEYVAGMDPQAFGADRRTQDAVVRQLEIIGEASRNLSEPFQADHPEIPWRAIVGMRNRIVHEYMAIDLDVVWDAVSIDLPPLLEFTRRWV
jgi:uncharacterized protein with HEPN domain